jgi:branched-chain amino acid transport system ATP-binding protein
VNDARPLLSVDHLTVWYGHVQALDDVSIRAERGEVVGVIGPNGAGKTTLLRTLSGLTPARSGSAELDGKQLLGTAPYKVARLGFAHVPEGRGTIAPLTVAENLRLGGSALSAARARERMAELYEAFPALARLKDRRAGLLSGGEQQMMVIARGLMMSPSVLAIDEPSMGLAPTVVRGLMGVLRVAASSGVAIVLVEQNSALAAQIADRIYVLVRGTVRSETASGELPVDLLEEYLA